VDIPIVDWLNLISSSPSSRFAFFTVIASPLPEPVKILPVSASTNLICNPIIVFCTIFIPDDVIYSSSEIE